MNNQSIRNQYNYNEDSSLAELKTVLTIVHDGCLKQEHRTLIAIIDHLQKILVKKFSENPTPIRPKDYNISSAIYEKCLMIKNKNESLKVSVLNLRASLSKMMSQSRQSFENQGTYNEIVESIRKKSSDVRIKLEKYQGVNAGAPRLTNSELLRSRGVVELKKGTEWLQRKTLQIKREVEVWRQYCISQSSYRD